MKEHKILHAPNYGALYLHYILRAHQNNILLFTVCWLFKILRMNYPNFLLIVWYRTISNLRKMGRHSISKSFTSYTEAPEGTKAIRTSKMI